MKITYSKVFIIFSKASILNLLLDYIYNSNLIYSSIIYNLTIG